MAQEQWATRYIGVTGEVLVDQLSADLVIFGDTRIVQQLLMVERGNPEESGRGLLTLIALWNKRPGPPP